MIVKFNMATKHLSVAQLDVNHLFENIRCSKY